MMISRSQLVLLISLLAWLGVVYKLFTLRAESKAKTLRLNELKTAVPSAVIEPKAVNAAVPVPVVEPAHSPKASPATATTPAVAAVAVAAKATARKGQVEDYAVQSVPWMTFASLPSPAIQPPTSSYATPGAGVGAWKPIICPPAVQEAIDSRLSPEQVKWCEWTLSDSGGKVKVGKSYGNLDAKAREKYEQFNCNAVALGKNPSCNDAWGDNHITYWKTHPIPDLCSSSSSSPKTSTVSCYDSPNLARFCVFDNLLMDVSKMHNVKRPGRSDSRKWDKGFLASHCDREKEDINYYEFYAPSVNPVVTKCDHIINETVLIYGHDDIHNLGHSMSDFMNVHTMLWLAGIRPEQVLFLNADAIRQGHNYYDDLGKFSYHYDHQFAGILKLSSFPAHAQVCLKKVIFMPRPLVLYTWDGWWQDMRCSFTGPSSLYQRWNMEVRSAAGLLAQPVKSIEVLLIIRSSRTASSQQTSRMLKNLPLLEEMIQSIEGVHLTAMDLSKLPFEEQIQLIARSSVLVGMHGAGIASSMHMNIGSPNCCGVIEIFPVGEFHPIRGYGNMARRMGLTYTRMELGGADSHGDGAVVPVEQLKDLLTKTIESITKEPTCVLPSVWENPYFLN